MVSRPWSQHGWYRVCDCRSARQRRRFGCCKWQDRTAGRRSDQQASGLRRSRQSRWHTADVGTAAGIEKLTDRFPDVDMLVNNAGIFEVKPFEQIDDEDWKRLFEVNVLSGVRLSRHYLAGMKKRNWGRIVFISSESAVQIPAEMIHYGMTKTAQLAIARGLAETTTGTNVTVNSVLPGPTASEGVERFVRELAAEQKTDPGAVEDEFFRTMRPTSLLKRFAKPEEVAAMVAFACSPVSSATNGAALRADGRRRAIDSVSRRLLHSRIAGVNVTISLPICRAHPTSIPMR
ncbi:MAG: SDR family oxidoreductase [Candidatus Sulfotelmatobacter sp.]